MLDLAGTTVDDGGHVAGALGAALAAHGIPATEADVSAVRGASKREALRGLVPPGADHERRAAAAYAAFLEELACRLEGGVRAMPGAAEAFRALRARGVRVALNTGFDRDTTARILAAVGWDAGTVDAVVCVDDVAAGRPAPYLIFRAIESAGATSVHRVANVGDTVLDLEAARNAGVRWSIGVLSGAHDRARLEQAPHTHLIASVAELPALWL